jgi:hypothetical protein
MAKEVVVPTLATQHRAHACYGSRAAVAAMLAARLVYARLLTTYCTARSRRRRANHRSHGAFIHYGSLVTREVGVSKLASANGSAGVQRNITALCRVGAYRHRQSHGWE